MQIVVVNLSVFTRADTKRGGQVASGCAELNELLSTALQYGGRAVLVALVEHAARFRNIYFPLTASDSLPGRPRHDEQVDLASVIHVRDRSLTSSACVFRMYDIELQCARQRWRRKKLSRLIAGRSIARRTSAIDIPGEKNSGTLHSRNENIAVVVYNKDAINCNSGGLSPSIFVRLRVHRAQCQGDRSLPVAER
ncbi:hypothetical protein G5I_06452 [Acromyrmex echinatior]|uniref:Uncharacterized protein n=1 Tax=Acromyrmex echinatior TaxID=103372 RepID=F4WL29_ACREC|nr:hypothetical protein G5I_06452 [Acromyrmex echinatior]